MNHARRASGEKTPGRTQRPKRIQVVSAEWPRAAGGGSLIPAGWRVRRSMANRCDHWRDRENRWPAGPGGPVEWKFGNERRLVGRQRGLARIPLSLPRPERDDEASEEDDGESNGSLEERVSEDEDEEAGPAVASREANDEKDPAAGDREAGEGTRNEEPVFVPEPLLGHAGQDDHDEHGEGRGTEEGEPELPDPKPGAEAGERWGSPAAQLEAAPHSRLATLREHGEVVSWKVRAKGRLPGPSGRRDRTASRIRRRGWW